MPTLVVQLHHHIFISSILSWESAKKDTRRKIGVTASKSIGKCSIGRLPYCLVRKYGMIGENQFSYAIVQESLRTLALQLSLSILSSAEGVEAL